MIINNNPTKRLRAILLTSTVIATFGIASSAMATDTQTSTTLAKEITALQQQITDLNKKIQSLEVSQKQSAEMTKQAAVDAARQEAAAQAKMTPTPWTKGPDGYITVPGTNTALKLGGRVRGEMMYDGGPNMGDFIAPQTIPLKGINNAASQSGNTNASARASRVNFATLTPTAKGDVKTLIEFDFFGGGTGTNYNPRLRHAYGTFAGFLVGQTDSVFIDVDTLGSNIDGNGILGGGLRQMQIRYTQDFSSSLQFMTALEKPSSDYISGTGTLVTSNDQSAPTGSTTNAAKSSLPDLTAQLRYTGNAGYVGVRGMVRQIQYRTLADVGGNAANDYSKKATGWGAGLSGKLFTFGKSAITGQVNTGQGIGRYIPEIAGEAAYFNPTSTATATAPAQFNVLKANNVMIGYEHYWTDNIRSNLQASYTRVSPPSGGFPVLTGTTRITQKIKKVFFNVLYNPVKNIETGIEFAHIRRDTMDNQTGSGNRISVAATYSF